MIIQCKPTEDHPAQKTDEQIVSGEKREEEGAVVFEKFLLSSGVLEYQLYWDTDSAILDFEIDQDYAEQIKEENRPFVKKSAQYYRDLFKRFKDSLIENDREGIISSQLQYIRDIRLLLDFGFSGKKSEGEVSPFISELYRAQFPVSRRLLAILLTGHFEYLKLMSYDFDAIIGDQQASYVLLLQAMAFNSDDGKQALIHLAENHLNQLDQLLMALDRGERIPEITGWAALIASFGSVDEDQYAQGREENLKFDGFVFYKVENNYLLLPSDFEGTNLPDNQLSLTGGHIARRLSTVFETMPPVRKWNTKKQVGKLKKTETIESERALRSQNAEARVSDLESKIIKIKQDRAKARQEFGEGSPQFQKLNQELNVEIAKFSRAKAYYNFVNLRKGDKLSARDVENLDQYLVRLRNQIRTDKFAGGSSEATLAVREIDLLRVRLQSNLDYNYKTGDFTLTEKKISGGFLDSIDKHLLTRARFSAKRTKQQKILFDD